MGSQTWEMNGRHHQGRQEKAARRGIRTSQSNLREGSVLPSWRRLDCIARWAARAIFLLFRILMPTIILARSDNHLSISVFTLFNLLGVIFRVCVCDFSKSEIIFRGRCWG